MWVLVAVMCLAIWVAGYQMLKIAFDKNDYINRIGIYTGQIEVNKEEKPKKQDQYRQGLGILAKGIEKAGIFNNYKEGIKKKLTNANILMRPEEFISICVICFVISAVLGALLSGKFLVILVSGIIGWIIPGIILRRNISRRLKTINTQLGDTIAILSNAMKAGHSFFQAVDSVSREMTGPVADEFSKLQKEINLGVNTETALENMVNRVGSDDLELMVTAVLIQRQVGGNLSEVLDNISGTIRQRITTKTEIKTLTAQGRMSGLIISLLPLVLSVMISVISPDQMKVLVTDPLGKVMIAAAVILELVGIVFVRKIVNVEV
jgi:tight adherence protein B